MHPPSSRALATCSTNPFLLEQQLRAQYSLANLLFCVGIWVGSPRYIPEKPICIHGLWTCTFPVLVIIYLKHYLYSCTPPRAGP